MVDCNDDKSNNLRLEGHPRARPARTRRRAGARERDALEPNVFLCFGPPRPSRPRPRHIFNSELVVRSAAPACRPPPALRPLPASNIWSAYGDRVNGGRRNYCEEYLKSNVTLSETITCCANSELYERRGRMRVDRGPHRLREACVFGPS
ncbi:hypothetical protein EVAR_42756_1 [Eumeta japonica]|uniref:Uncharacterized protein n=1 Tax=Eumeta variegata TaxID=151549 RepID=A0A4C1WN81_EUMVA|nr:hypothetical protein EVAR_42756_1 [Eumeta japonica]